MMCRPRWFLSMSAVLLATLTPLGSAQTDSWSAEGVLLGENAGEYFAPVHAILLPDETVMLFGFIQTGVQPTNICGRVATSTAILTPPAVGQAMPSTLTPNMIPELVDRTPTPPNTYCFPERNCIPTATCTSDTYFCSGHTLLPNGNVLRVGGLRIENLYVNPSVNMAAGGGLEYSSRYTSVTDDVPTWVRVPGSYRGVPTGAVTTPPPGIWTGRERYYPTATRLQSGLTLLVGSAQILNHPQASGSVENRTVDLYDWTTDSHLPPTSLPPEGPAAIFNPDYTHSFALPQMVQTYDVLMFGDDGVPVYLDVVGQSWTVVADKIGGFPVPLQRPTGPNAKPSSSPNVGTSTVMLPIRQPEQGFGYGNGSVLHVGGEGGGPDFPLGYSDHADVYDVSVGNLGDWTTQLVLQLPRHHPSTVLLPDGQVAVLCGHLPDPCSPQLTQRVEYIDPRNGMNQTLGTVDPHGLSRGYHTITLLLPDGRLLIGGGRDGGNSSSTRIERASLQFLSPPYMFRDRPTIVTAPPTITSGGASFMVQGAGPIAEAVLVGLGSMTHSFDMNQRHVQLDIISNAYSPDSGTYTAIVAPPAQGGFAAPPGHYMLFVLAADGQFTPSEAKIVLVQ